MKARRPTRGEQIAAAAAGRIEDIVKPSTRLSDYMDVARLITPQPPAWLGQVLLKSSAPIWLHARVLDLQPSRARVRMYLKWLESTVAPLARALGEPPVRNFLDAAGEGKITYHGALDGYLRDLRARAARALASPELATPSGKTKAGKGPALPPGAVHPASLCALIIVEAWKYVHGAYPGPRSVKAAEAAEAYWKACGNMRNSWGANPLTAWRRRFEVAMWPAFDEQRAEVVRSISRTALGQARIPGGTQISRLTGRFSST